MTRLSRRWLAVLAAVAAVSIATTGLVYALRVGVAGDGYLYACYSTKNGDVHLRQKGANCGPGWIPTRWYATKPVEAVPALPLAEQFSASRTLRYSVDYPVIAQGGGDTDDPDLRWPDWHVTADIVVQNNGAEAVEVSCGLATIIFNDESLPTFGDWTARLGPAGSSDDSEAISLTGLSTLGYGSSLGVLCRAEGPEPMNVFVRTHLTQFVVNEPTY